MAAAPIFYYFCPLCQYHFLPSEHPQPFISFLTGNFVCPNCLNHNMTFKEIPTADDNITQLPHICKAGTFDKSDSCIANISDEEFHENEKGYCPECIKKYWKERADEYD